MKKIAILAIFFLLVAASMAAADVTVTGQVNKDKDITVSEEVDIDKDIGVEVNMNVEGTKAAEAESVLNQEQTGNFACENCAEKRSVLMGSILENSGLVNLNQATGNMLNQTNVVSFAVDTEPPPDEPPPVPGYGFAHAQTEADQRVVENQIDTVNVAYRDALIADSINDNTGVVLVNQAVGNIFNQANMLTVGISLSGLMALAEADLGQENVGNVFNETNTYKSSVIGGEGGSINGNRGVVEVNQSAGTLGNQLNAVNISASTVY